MFDALRRFWRYPLNRGQVALVFAGFLLALYIVTGDIWAPLFAFGAFIVIGVIPYLLTRYRGR
ncbi:MAG TPA: hypothetical protein VHR55_07980 [Candidatus Limnocylindria bacterium]|nr:hypothetical protein [Candidatus Limnocylindria bacterium]